MADENAVQPGEYGWAPGGYLINCINHGRTGVNDPGCDKRAIRCKACAQKMKDTDRLAKAVGQQIEQAYPFGYRSEDNEP